MSTIQNSLLDIGFKEIFIRQVPLGHVLSAETADQYPLIASGAFANKDNFQIIPSLEKDKYHVMPPTNEGKYFELSIHNGSHDLKTIIDYFKNLKK